MRPMRTAPGRSLLGIGVILAMAAVLIAAMGLLGAMPAVLAFALLYCGQYPGARRLDRAIEARRAGRLRQRPPCISPMRPSFVLVSRGGQLIASSLAKRPPPRLLFAT